MISFECIDHKVVEELMKLDETLKYDDIVKAVLSPANSNVKVAYHLLYDAEQNRIRNNQIHEITTPNENNSNSIPSATPTPDDRRTKKIRTLTPPKPRDAVQRRWHLGIQSARDPFDVMSDIYNVLVILDFKWKILTPYQIRIRKYISSTSPTDAPRRLEIGLTLYKNRENYYLVDFQKIEGDTITYLHICSSIITYLRMEKGGGSS